MADSRQSLPHQKSVWSTQPTFAVQTAERQHCGSLAVAEKDTEKNRIKKINVLTIKYRICSLHLELKINNIFVDPLIRHVGCSLCYLSVLDVSIHSLAFAILLVSVVFHYVSIVSLLTLLQSFRDGLLGAEKQYTNIKEVGMYRLLFSLILSFVSVQATWAEENLSSVVATAKSKMNYIKQLEQKQPGSAVAAKKALAKYVIETIDNRLWNCNSPHESVVGTYTSACSNVAKERQAYAGNLRKTALRAWETGAGRCDEHASLAYYILKEAGAGDDLRLMSDAEKNKWLPGGTHAFVVWGVKKGAKLHDPSSWGKQAISVDAWTESVGSGIEAGQKIVDDNQTPVDMTQQRTSNKKPWMIPTNVRASEAVNSDTERQWLNENMGIVSYKGKYHGKCNDGFQGGGDMQITFSSDNTFSGKLMGQLKGGIGGSVASDGGVFFRSGSCKFWGTHTAGSAAGKLSCTGSGGCTGGWSAK